MCVLDYLYLACEFLRVGARRFGVSGLIKRLVELAVSPAVTLVSVHSAGTFCSKVLHDVNNEVRRCP